MPSTDSDRPASGVRRVLVRLLILGAAIAASLPETGRADVPSFPDEALRPPEVPKDKGYYVREIRSGLYWLSDGAYGTMFLVHGTA